MLQRSQPAPDINGLWVLLVESNADAEAHATLSGQVPMMARCGADQDFLLGFKNAAVAREFLATSEIEGGAEPRMVMESNLDLLVTVARENGAVGILVDYNPATQEYASAGAL